MDDVAYAQFKAAHKTAESIVKKHIGYDPEQKTHTNEIHPRFKSSGGLGHSVTPITGYSAAFRLSRNSCNISSGCCEIRPEQCLQLKHLPVRRIDSITVNGELWNEGSDYEAEWCSDCLSETGTVIANSCWPCENNSIEVTYVAGYSQSELFGDTSDKVIAADQAKGIITCPDVDALPLSKAIADMTAICLASLQGRSADACGGVSSLGPFESESLGDGVSYRRSEYEMQILLMQVGLPPEICQLLECYVHWGL